MKNYSTAGGAIGDRLKLEYLTAKSVGRSEALTIARQVGIEIESALSDTKEFAEEQLDVIITKMPLSCMFATIEGVGACLFVNSALPLPAAIKSVRELATKGVDFFDYAKSRGWA